MNDQQQSQRQDGRNDDRTDTAAPQMGEEGDLTGGLKGNQTGGDWDNRPPSAEDLAPHLAGLQFPISKADLVQSMRWQKAPLPVIYFLEKLPERDFASEADIRQAVQQLG